MDYDKIIKNVFKNPNKLTFNEIKNIKYIYKKLNLQEFIELSEYFFQNYKHENYNLYIFLNFF